MSYRPLAIAAAVTALSVDAHYQHCGAVRLCSARRRLHWCWSRAGVLDAPVRQLMEQPRT